MPGLAGPEGCRHSQGQTEIRQVGREFNRRLAARAKPPTLKQFASFAAEPARMIENVDSRMREWNCSRLARDGLRYIQLWDATGGRPSFKLFNRETFNWEILGGEDVDFAAYSALIDKLRVG